MDLIRPRFRAGDAPSAGALDRMSRAIYEVRSGRGITAHVDGGRLMVELSNESSQPCTVYAGTGANVTIKRALFFTRSGVSAPFESPADWSLEISGSDAVTVIFCRYLLQSDEWETQNYVGGDYPFLTESGADANNFINNTVTEAGYYVIPIAIVYFDVEKQRITGIVQLFTGHPTHITERSGTVIIAFTDPDTVGDLDNWPGWSMSVEMQGRLPVGYDTESGGVFDLPLTVGQTYGAVKHGFSGDTESHIVSMDNNTVMVQAGSDYSVLSSSTVPTDVQEATHIPPVRVVCFLVKD